MKVNYLTNKIIFEKFDKMDSRQFINIIMNKYNVQLYSDINFLKYCLERKNISFTIMFWVYAFVKSKIELEILFKNFANIILDPDFDEMINNVRNQIEKDDRFDNLDKHRIDNIISMIHYGYYI